MRFRPLVTTVAVAALVGAVTIPIHAKLNPAQSAEPAAIPTPEEYFGFEMGTAGRLASFPDIEEYFQLVDDESSEVEYEVVDQTTLGNDYPILRLSSEENLGRLDEILDINERLSDPRVIAEEAADANMPPAAYARDLAAQSVPVYYVEGTLHATEVGNTQALVDIVHRLATEDSDFTDQVLDNTVVLIVPSANPDGQHLVLDHFNDTAGTRYNRVYPDLYHHYAGHDNNRDWFMFTQQETRTRVRLEQQYRPVAQHYMHQAGQTSPRIWSPAYDEPLSTAIDPITMSSANALGLEVHSDLVAEGRKGAKWDDAYGIFWNADVTGYSAFQGTSTFLTEIASVRDLAYPYRSEEVLPPSDLTMRSVLPYDRKTWTLDQIVEYAKTAAYSGMETVANSAPEWLYNNLYRSNVNDMRWQGGPYAYVVSSDQRDPYAAYDLLRIFDFGRVEMERATSPFRAGGERYPRGSIVIKVRQPMGRWVDQLLRIDEYPDNARKCDECPLIMPYSETTDNIALFMGADADAVEQRFEAQTTPVDEIVPTPQVMPADPGADGVYAVGPESYGLGKFVSGLQSAGITTYRASRAVELAGRTLPPGALLVPASEDGAREVLETASEETGLPVYANAAMPSVPAIELADDTRIGLIRGANNMPGGWMMWMFDQFGVDYEVVSADDYDRLGRKYDTIVLATGVSPETITEGLDPKKNPPEFHWARGVPDGLAKLRRFVRQGGNLVALGDASLTATEALDLPLRDITPYDSDDFNVPGALLEQRYRIGQPAAWGMPRSWPVWYDNDPAFELTGAGAVASTYPRGNDLLVSGYASGSGALANATNVATFDVGEGEATVVGSQITFRTWPRATWTVVTNALYNGAGEEVPTLR
jgi:Zinc carboxypeptidase